MEGTQILMHKGDELATCSFDSRGYLKAVSKVHNKDLLPLCVRESGSVLDLQRWILARNLATNRRDIAPLREFYGSLAFQPSTGISLFDCYWFANKERNDWEKENAYDNWDCRKDSLYMMLAYPDEVEAKAISTHSPNLTIPGREQRLWYKAKGNIYLLHGDAQKEMSDYKEAASDDIMAERNYVILSGIIYAAVKSETSKEVERVSLEEVYNLYQDPDKSKMQNLQTCCEKFHIPDWKDFLSKMCDLDERTGNTTRELSDIGVLRNSSTLETIGFAKL